MGWWKRDFGCRCFLGQRRKRRSSGHPQSAKQRPRVIPCNKAARVTTQQEPTKASQAGCGRKKNKIEGENKRSTLDEMTDELKKKSGA